MNDIGDKLQPLEDNIRNNDIPSLLGRNVSDEERDMLALPGRLGRAALEDPVKSSRRKHKESLRRTHALVEKIMEQDLRKLPDVEKQQKDKAEMRTLKECRLTNQ